VSPGDILRITVWRHPELSGEFPIAGDGTLLHPLYQRVQVVGVTLGVAKERLRELLATYEQDAQLTLQPLFPVSVGGEVRQPNLYRLPEGTTVAQAVATAGGPTERGRLDRVRLLRGQRVINFDLTSGVARTEGDRIVSGDQILVARQSNFSFVRDVIVPVTSVTAAVAAMISVSRQ
jgi:polysaccharide export outer membrane protein